MNITKLKFTGVNDFYKKATTYINHSTPPIEQDKFEKIHNIYQDDKNHHYLKL